MIIHTITLNAENAILRKIKTGVFWLGVLAISAFGQMSDDLLNPPAQITTRATLDKIHYAKRGIAVLADTLYKLPENANAFVATKKIFIPKGVSLQIPAGKDIYFEPGARLEVAGTLSATGSKATPIYFMLMPRNAMYLEPPTADSLWNGIIVKNGGRLILTDAAINGTFTGVQSDAPCDSLFIANVTFSHIHESAISIENNTISVPINMPYTLDCTKTKTLRNSRKLSAMKVAIESKKNAALRVGMACVAAVGVGTTAFGLYQYSKNLELYNNSASPLETNNYKRSSKNGTLLAIIGGTGAVLGAAGFGLTFYF